MPPAGLASRSHIRAGTGNCIGISGKIPCQCPPSRASFLASLQANIAAGHAVHNPGVGVSFPTDSAPASQRTRIEASIVTLQNLQGPGVGCPASSTTFSVSMPHCACGGEPDVFVGAVGGDPGMKDTPLCTLRVFLRYSTNDNVYRETI